MCVNVWAACRSGLGVRTRRAHSFHTQLCASCRRLLVHLLSRVRARFRRGGSARVAAKERRAKRGRIPSDAAHLLMLTPPLSCFAVILKVSCFYVFPFHGLFSSLLAHIKTRQDFWIIYELEMILFQMLCCQIPISSCLHMASLFFILCVCVSNVNPLTHALKLNALKINGWNGKICKVSQSLKKFLIKVWPHFFKLYYIFIIIRKKM